MSNARVLVVYYSRSGVTARAAKALANRLGADLEEIVERCDRSGPLGFVGSVIDVLRELPARINNAKHDPFSYELVVIATPVWVHRVATPVRTWLTAYRARLPNVAFLCTFGGSGAEAALAQMADISGRSPLARCQIDACDVRDGAQVRLLEIFAERLECKLAHVEALEWTC
ncbi:flavodoxin [Caballeronia sp. LjRoot34]|uniref:flavodoxin family protein n=1 Tax=Caballeronia sp. LjRoot34 TaxID=3342325 RepID=UPI003ECDE6B2